MLKVRYLENYFYPLLLHCDSSLRGGAVTSCRPKILVVIDLSLSNVLSQDVNEMREDRKMPPLNRVGGAMFGTKLE